MALGTSCEPEPPGARVGRQCPGERSEHTGEVIPMDVAVGDEIIFSKYGGTEVKVGADDVLILRQTDVLAKVVATGGKAKGKKELAGAAA